MAEHNDFGKAGEDLATKYLIRDGYKIIERNWKHHKFELDIIAQKGGELIIIEVKTRKNELFARPQDAVNERKIRNIALAADQYIKMNERDMPVRFDIISITGTGNDVHLEHIEDAFTAPLM